MADDDQTALAPGSDEKPTQVTPAAVSVSPPRAYDLEPAIDYPWTEATPRGAGRVRWALSLAALLAAAAALLVSMRLWTAPGHTITLAGPVTTVTQPTRTVTLTKPDQDTAFLMDLRNLEPRTLFPAGAEIHNAHYVCGALYAGKSPEWIVEQFAVQVSGEGEISRMAPDESRAFIPVAAQHYCPDVAP